MAKEDEKNNEKPSLLELFDLAGECLGENTLEIPERLPADSRSVFE